MDILINGRGVTMNIPTMNIPTNMEIPEEEEEIISIEEYRKIQFTEEQEWNSSYNPKRCSIEALNFIEIKRKGKGDIKKVYKSFSDTENGPYYDPIGVHICTWRNNKQIINFKCEQDPSSVNIQFSVFKPGIYCAICHIKKECREFNWEKRENIKVNRFVLSTHEYKYPPVVPDIKKPRISLAIPNWNKLMIKCLYSLYNNKTVYCISKYNSIIIWPWQMTPYQLFKHNNPNYKESIIFLDSDMEKFKDNYAIIE